MYTKDYYSILGILPSAEDIVIRAAYKALAQRYHPDKNQGDQAGAQARMREINEAYGVLSDAAKRAEYDGWYASQKSSGEYRPADGDDELAAAMHPYDDDWNTACEVYPDLGDIVERLSRVATRLALTYKILLLESRAFAKRGLLAAELEHDFLKRYFGEKPEILKFAKELIANGHKKAAKKLNSYIRVIGDDGNSQQIIRRVCDDFNIVTPEQQRRHDLARWDAMERQRRKEEARRQEEGRHRIFATLDFRERLFRVLFLLGLLVWFIVLVRCSLN